MTEPLQVIISDTHAGGFTALASEEFLMSDKQVIRRSINQDWLADRFLDFLLKIKRRAVGRRVIGFHLGDCIDGDHHQTVQALPSVYDQEKMAKEVLGPFRSLCDRFYMLFGTEAHEGDGWQAARRVADDLSVDAIDWELRFRIGNGPLCLYTHHGRAGGRPWTTGAAGVASEVMLQCAERGEEVPRFVFTGHRHRIDDSGEKFANIRVLSCPAWQLVTGHGAKVGPFTLSHVGGVFVEGENVEVIRYQAPRRPIASID